MLVFVVNILYIKATETVVVKPLMITFEDLEIVSIILENVEFVLEFDVQSKNLKKNQKYSKTYHEKLKHIRKSSTIIKKAHGCFKKLKNIPKG